MSAKQNILPATFQTQVVSSNGNVASVAALLKQYSLTQSKFIGDNFTKLTIPCKFVKLIDQLNRLYYCLMLELPFMKNRNFEMCTAQPSPKKSKCNDQLYFNVLNIKYIRLVFLFLGMNYLFPIELIAQTNKPSTIKSKTSVNVPVDENVITQGRELRETKKRRIRWEAIQFMDNGDAYYKEQPYTGGAYALFPSKTPNSTEAPKIAKVGEFLNGKFH